MQMTVQSALVLVTDLQTQWELPDITVRALSQDSLPQSAAKDVGSISIRYNSLLNSLT